MLKAARGQGAVLRLDLRSQRFYLLNHLDYVKHVLQKNSKNYVKGYVSSGSSRKRSRPERRLVPGRGHHQSWSRPSPMSVIGWVVFEVEGGWLPV